MAEQWDINITRGRGRDGAWHANVSLDLVFYDDEPFLASADDEDHARERVKWAAIDAARAATFYTPRPPGRPKGQRNERHPATCERCATTFSAGRGGTRFCSGRCRTAAHRAGDSQQPQRAEVPADVVAKDRRLARPVR